MDGLPWPGRADCYSDFPSQNGCGGPAPPEDKGGTLFYADAESILGQVPRRGIPMILHDSRNPRRRAEALEAIFSEWNG